MKVGCFLVFPKGRLPGLGKLLGLEPNMLPNSCYSLLEPEPPILKSLAKLLSQFDWIQNFVIDLFYLCPGGPADRHEMEDSGCHLRGRGGLPRHGWSRLPGVGAAL